MTSTQAVDQVRILLDKYSTPYFTDDEVLGFLNMAQLEILNRMFPDTLGGVANFEADQNIFQNIAPLIYNFTGLMDADGNFPFTGTGSLAASLVTLSGDSNARAFRIIAISARVDGTDTPVRFVRYNNLWANNTNSFKKPTASAFQYTIGTNTLAGKVVQFYPVSRFTVLIFSVIKYPKIMTIGNTPDWDDYMMNAIIEIACQYGAVSMRDSEGQQQLNSTTISK